MLRIRRARVQETMEEHASPITHLVNHYLVSFVLSILNALHIKPGNAAEPIPQPVVMGMIALIILTLLALVLRSRLSVEKPGSMQQIAEMILTNPMGIGVRDVLDTAGGHHGRSFLPF